MGKFDQVLLTNFLKTNEIFIPDYPNYVDYVGYYKKNYNRNRDPSYLTSSDAYTSLTGYEPRDTEMKIMKDLDHYSKKIQIDSKTIRVIDAEQLYIFLRTRGYSTILYTELSACYVLVVDYVPRDNREYIKSRLEDMEERLSVLDKDEIYNKLMINLHEAVDTAIMSTVKCIFKDMDVEFVKENMEKIKKEL